MPLSIDVQGFKEETVLMWRHAQAPDAMRSLASALQLLTTALGSYVATAVTTIINSVSPTPHAGEKVHFST